MQLSLIWMPLMLLATVALAVFAAVLVLRALPRRRPLSVEEQREMATAPMPALQRHAWWGLGVVLATLATISVLLVRRGVAEYWDNDAFRLSVVLLFIGGLLAYAVVFSLALARSEARGELDERDRVILSRAPRLQSVLMLLALAAWTIALQEMFHGQGGVPRVYLNLLFGSMCLIYAAAESLGVLVGYWLRLGNGES